VATEDKAAEDDMAEEGLPPETLSHDDIHLERDRSRKGRPLQHLGVGGEGEIEIEERSIIFLSPWL
jgi:hypothetical protein